MLEYLWLRYSVSVANQTKDRESECPPLLFAVPAAGQDEPAYVLIEHTSAPDPLLAFRMLRSVVGVWDRYLREHPQAQHLPLVIPLVIHHGRTPWTGPTRLQDLIGADPDAREAGKPYLPQFEFLLDDLAGVDAQQLAERGLSPASFITFLMLNTADGNPNVAEQLRPWSDQLRAIFDGPGGAESFREILIFIARVSATDPGELRELAASLGPDAQEAYMTTAEMLSAEGGAEVLTHVLVARFGPLPDDVSETVRGAAMDQLLAWATRAVTAGTLDEALG